MKGFNFFKFEGSRVTEHPAMLTTNTLLFCCYLWCMHLGNIFFNSITVVLIFILGDKSAGGIKCISYDELFPALLPSSTPQNKIIELSDLPLNRRLCTLSEGPTGTCSVGKSMEHFAIWSVQLLCTLIIYSKTMYFFYSNKIWAPLLLLEGAFVDKHWMLWRSHN